jgi:drug/metabolite transporter (DMT)-like permease
MARRARRTARVGPAALILLVGSAVCYAFLPIFGKIAYREGMTLLPILSTRFLLADVILWLMVAVRPRLRAACRSLPRRRAGALFAWGIGGFAGQSALYFGALRTIPASLSEVLLYTCPAFVALLLWGLTRRPPSGARLFAIGLAVAGTWLCSGAPGLGDPGSGAAAGVVPADPRGVALAVAAGLWYATFLLLLDRVSPGVPETLASAWIIGGAACTTSGAAALAGALALPPTPAAWGAILGMVASATVLGLILFVAGMKRAGPQVTSILSTFEPLGTILLASALLGERLRSIQWAGAGLVLGAAALLAITGGTEARGAAPGGAAGPEPSPWRD